MKLISVLLLLCTIFSLGTVSIAGTPGGKKSLYYEVKVSSKSFGNMGTRKLWLKGNNMRWEMVSAKLPIRVVKNEGGIFLIHPWNKVAAKYPAGSPRGNPQVYLPGPIGPIKAFLSAVKAVKSGQVTVDKQRCNVYSYRDGLAHRQCKIWVGVTSGKPVQLLVTGTKGKVDTITAVYTKYEEGKSVSDSLFELPKGYKVVSMPANKLTSKETTEKRLSKKAS